LISKDEYWGGLAAVAGGYGPLGEAEHVGAQGVCGAAAAFVGREFVIGVNLFLEPLQEGLASRAGAGATVDGAAPRDFGRYSPVDVLGCDVASPPLGVTFCACLWVCLTG
jgi:hypothetical protein